MKCVICGYDLRGNPFIARCPECGTEYDAKTTVWFPQTGVSLILRTGPIILTGTALSLLAFTWRKEFGVVVALLLWIYVLAFLVQGLRLRKSWFVAISPLGVISSKPGWNARPEVLPWEQVTRSVGGVNCDAYRVSRFLQNIYAPLERSEREAFRKALASRLIASIAKTAGESINHV